MGIIAIVLIAVLHNYFRTWYQRSRAEKRPVPILSSETIRSVEDVDYSGYHQGVLRYRIHARRAVEKREGSTLVHLLEGIEVHDFSPEGVLENEIHSQKATYYPERKIADLRGDVRIFLGQRIELQTESLHYNLSAGTGTTSDLLRIRSEEINGSSHGVKFDSNRRILDLFSKVDLFLTPKLEGEGGLAAPARIHAVSDHASFSDLDKLFILRGNARVESGDRVLIGETVRAVMDPDHGRITSITAEKNAAYTSQEGEGNRSITGETMVFSIGATGIPERIAVSQKANFAVTSGDGEQTLDAQSIEIDFDAEGLPLLVKGRKRVRFHLKRGSALTTLSGDELSAGFASETGSLESVEAVGKDAEMVVEDSAKSQRNELKARKIEVSLAAAGGRAVLRRIHADGGVRYSPAVPGKGASRTLKAGVLDMFYSEDGEYLKNGTASGKVVMSETHSGPAVRPQLRELTADLTRFDFFPGDNQLKSLEAEGHVEVKFRNGASGGNPRTTSSRLKATFSENAVESMSQWGDFEYKDDAKSAFAGRCDYIAADGIVILRDRHSAHKESPRITDAFNSTTGERMEFDQNRKVLVVNGNVRSRLNNNKGDGSFFGSSDSSSPGIVIAREMRYWEESRRALYTGDVRFLSEEQQLQAQVLEIVGGGEQIEANGRIRHFVPAKQESGIRGDSPILIRSSSLKYVRGKNALTYSGDVTLNSEDVSMAAALVDAILSPDGKTVERATARKEVLIRQKARECRGDSADWYLEPGKFVVLGEPAEVYDPERGRSFARRLTSFTGNDRIVLENR